LITCWNSDQSIAPNAQFFVSSLYARSGSGSVTFTACACGTVRFTNRWRSSSLVNRFTRQRSKSAEFGESLSEGPNIMSVGHHQRLTASCTIVRCSGVPAASAATSS
jgi:hypothetical protein